MLPNLPPYVIVPDLRDQTQNIAAEILGKYGLRLGDISTGSASMPAGTIYAQVPIANERHSPHTARTLSD